MKTRLAVVCLASIVCAQSALGSSQAGADPKWPAPQVIAHGEALTADFGDFDGDGVTDVVVLLDADVAGYSSFQLLIGDGAGEFVSKVERTTTQPEATRVFAVDWNGDGSLDVVVTGRNASAPHHADWFAGDGRGGFGPNASIPMPFEDAPLASMRDWSGDGVVDLLIADADDVTAAWSVAVLIGDAAGGVASAVVSPADVALVNCEPGDFDGDGDLDFAATVDLGGLPAVQVFLNDGGAGLAGATPTAVTTADDLAAGDLDGDGALDVVINRHLGPTQANLEYLLGDGAGGLADPVEIALTGAAVDVLIGDVDLDGRLDLIAPRRIGATDVLVADGSGGFESPITIGVSAGNSLATLFDWNGDGRPDLTTFGLGIAVTLAEGDGTPRFGCQPIVPIEDGLRLLAVADLDADQVPDQVVVDDADTTRVLFGDGAFGVASSVTLAQGLALGDTDVADLDGNGKPDLASIDPDGDRVRVFLGDGAGGFSASSFTVADRPTSIEVGDVSGDGLADVVVGHFSNPAVVTYVADGSGGFAAAATMPMPALPRIRLVDVDVDGDLDVACSTDFRVHACLNDGSGAFGPSIVFSIGPTDISLPTFADFDDDGLPDFVAQVANPSGLIFARGQGDGTFTLADEIAAPHFQSIDDADVDGDGRRDLVMVQRSSSSADSFCIASDPIVDGAFKPFGGTYGAALPYVTSLFAADLNRDGKRDLVYLARSSGFLEELAAIVPVSNRAVVAGNGFVYCEPKVNSQHCEPELAAAGQASVSSPNPFNVRARELLNKKTGQFFYGVAGPSHAPLFGGRLCVAPPFKRVPPLLNSGGSATGVDCTGTFVVDFNALIDAGGDPALVAGATVWAQAWSRDPGFAAPNNLSLTGGIAFTIQP